MRFAAKAHPREGFVLSPLMDGSPDDKNFCVWLHGAGRKLRRLYGAECTLHRDSQPKRRRANKTARLSSCTRARMTERYPVFLFDYWRHELTRMKRFWLLTAVPRHGNFRERWLGFHLVCLPCARRS